MSIGPSLMVGCFCRPVGFDQTYQILAIVVRQQDYLCITHTVSSTKKGSQTAAEISFCPSDHPYMGFLPT